MQNADSLFHDILDYLYQHMTDKNLNIEDYFTDAPYSILWKIGNELIKEGYSNETMQVALEFEKSNIINSRTLSEKELFELILMQRIIYSMYLGKLYHISEMAQSLASPAIQAEYASVINSLYETEEKSSLHETDKICLPYEEKLVKIIRKLIRNKKILYLLDLDIEYVDFVSKLLKEFPLASDEEIAIKVLQLQ